MIVKGLIKTIDFSDNTCMVRLPIFETVASQGEVILKAVILTQPGLYNGYTEGDVVFVDFENNRLNQPIVVGKLYLGAVKEENATKKGSLTVSNLTASTSATLPVTTKLEVDSIGTKVPVENGITSYSSIADIINALYKTEASVGKVSQSQQTELISSIKVEYLSQRVELVPPRADDPNWRIATPNYKDGFAIWQKTTCYNHRGQILSTEIICLSSLTSSAVYWLKCSTKVHVGTNQTEALVITAMVKFGAELEVEDESAMLIYKWSGEDSESEIKAGSKIYLNPTDLKDKNLLITAKHGDTEYETETILYSPLNTPLLLLSKETATLMYAADGVTLLSEPVETMASLYVNGNILPATYTWDFTNCTGSYEDNLNITGAIIGSTVTVETIDPDFRAGVARCTATVTADNAFKNKEYSKELSVIKGMDGTGIISQVIYYALVYSNNSPNDYVAGDLARPESDENLAVKTTEGVELPRLDIAETAEEKANAKTYTEWSDTPPAHTTETNGWKYWTSIRTKKTDNSVEYSSPIINEDLSGVYALAQGKSTNYYSDTDPANNPLYTMKDGDCWFDTSTNYVKVNKTLDLAVNDDGTFNTSAQYIGYYYYHNKGTEESPEYEYQKITSTNLDNIKEKETIAYKQEKNCLKQWSEGKWIDISEELVANKVTANYINALDITAKKIKILNDDGNTTLFEADGLNGQHKVQIAGFEVSQSGLYTENFGTSYSEAGKTSSGVYVGEDGIKLGENFYVDDEGNVVASSLKISSSQTIGAALGEVAANAQTNLENAFPTPASSSYTTLGDKWLSTTNVYAQNLHVANADITNKILVGDEENPILYANAKDEIVKIGGFKVTSSSITSGKKIDKTLEDGADQSGVYIGPDGISIGSGFKVTAGGSAEFSDNIKNDLRGFGIVASVSISPSMAHTEKWWNTYGATNYQHEWEGTSSSRNDCRIGDIFTVVGTAINTKNTHVLYYKSTTNSGNLEGQCLYHSIAKRGEPGAASTVPGPAGRSVLSTTKYYKLVPITDGTPAAPTKKEPGDWFTSPPPFESENNYYESVRTVYNTIVGGKDFEWSTPVQNSMLTVDFINTLGITAEKIDVVKRDADGNIEVDGNGNKKIIFSADAPSSTVSIGGFTVDSTQLKSKNEKLILNGAEGKIIANSGKIGGFTIDPPGQKEGLYSDYLVLNSEQVYFPVQAHLNLNNQVKIYTAVPPTGTPTSTKTSYISTLNNTDFIIQNQSGAGIKFSKDDPKSVTTTVNATITSYPEKESFGVLSAFDYPYSHSSGGLFGTDYYDVTWTFTCAIDTILSYPLDIKFVIQYVILGEGKTYQKSITCNMPAYKTSKIFTVTIEEDVEGSPGALPIYAFSDLHAATKHCGLGWTIPTITPNGVSKLTGPIFSYTDTNKTLYSLGHFMPNDPNCSLGGDNNNNVWSALHIKTATQYNSDSRLKKSIVPLSDDLDTLYDTIKPVSYKFNDGTSDRKHFGFIAQDLQQSLAALHIDTKDFAPLCIPKEKDAYMSIRYTEFIPLNTAQIQKLKKRVADQETRITELENIIKELQSR